MKEKSRAARVAGLLIGLGMLIGSGAGACSSDGADKSSSPGKSNCGAIGTECSINVGKPFFTDEETCVEYMRTVDPRGPDVDGDFIPDGDDDSSNDGLDDWGRPILDDEATCGCDTCIDESLACQKNLGCREIATCALNSGCRSIRECFWGEGWPGGVGPCRAIIDKWGAQSTSAALGEEISRCLLREGCPERKCPCAADDADCPTREVKTCPINLTL